MTAWSEQQNAIFSWFAKPQGNLVVRARAGTGKTTTILEAIKHISLEGQPQVLLCAFNKRIAEELKRRLAGPAEAKTLHSLGLKYLTGAWGRMNLDGDVDDDRIEAAVEADSPGEPAPPWDVKIALKKLIGIGKGGCTSVDEIDAGALAEAAIRHNIETESESYDAWWMGKIAAGAMKLALEPDAQSRITFDDMLFVPVVNGYAIPLYDWVIVDEAQDMNAAQLILAQKACRPGGHIVIVGDDRQAIYGFRGADSSALDRLKHELYAEELGLNTTYRCPKSVVDVAKDIVSDFYAAPTAPEGVVADITVDELLRDATGGDVILSRTNAPMVPLCLALVRKGTPAKIEGREVGKMLAARAKKLRATTVQEFIERLARWGNTARARAVARGKAVDAKLEQIRDIEETLMALAEDAETVNDIYMRCEKMFGDVAEGTPSNLVVLSTVHKAKGLEWERVYILRDTLWFYGKKRGDVEEDNIAYVAYTRSKSSLTFVQGQHVGA